MSRSYKRGIITLSKKLACNVRSAIRSKIKAKLIKIDPNEVDGLDLIDIESDAREMGEEYGTKMGFEFKNLNEFDDPDECREDLNKDRRK